jgi:hypothetical protein
MYGPGHQILGSASRESEERGEKRGERGMTEGQANAIVFVVALLFLGTALVVGSSLVRVQKGGMGADVDGEHALRTAAPVTGSGSHPSPLDLRSAERAEARTTNDGGGL